MKNKPIVYILIALIIVVVQSTTLLSALETKTEDWLYQEGSILASDIYVIGIDSDTLSEYGQFETWSRDKIADMINLLMENPETAPAVIGIDIGYYYEWKEDADQKLVEAVQNAGNVVLINTFEFRDKKGNVNVLEEPFEALKAAAKSVGFSNLQMDDDGAVRHALGRVNYNNHAYDSFAMEIYKQYLESQGLEFTETTKGYYSTQEQFYYMVYAGSAGSFYGSAGAGFSFNRVLKKEIPLKTFKDSIVLIGAYASGTQDNYYTAIDSDEKMYGVEIHANNINQLMNGDYKFEFKNLSRVIPTAIFVTIVCLIAILIKKRSISIALLVSLAVLYVVGAKMLCDHANVLLPILAPMLGVLIILIANIIMGLMSLNQEKKALVVKYSKFLSPAVADRVLKMGEDELGLDGTKKEVAVLFVDIRNFTHISEQMDPVEVVNMLNRFFSITTKAIFDHEGTVDKFIGDNTMGFFNAPLDVEDFAYKAVLAGLQMTKNLSELDAALPESLRGQVGFGVGIHVGEVVVGNIGTKERMEYTAIGDTVNVASRLEGQSAAGEVIISQTIYEKLKDRIVCGEPRKAKLKGKANEIQIYNVISVR